jgi:hypothetical protein
MAWQRRMQCIKSSHLTQTPQSVVRHLGRSANSGHYITDVRESAPAASAEDGAGKKGGGGGGSSSKPIVKWRRHDDSVVSHVRTQQ